MKYTKTISICMSIDKGGAGKSACTIGLAYYLAKAGYKVLAIDTDPQGNLTDNLSVDISELVSKKQTLFDAMSPDWDVMEAICHTPYKNLDLLASDNRLNMKIPELESMMGSFIFPYRDMVNIIKEQKVYDIIIFDTRPSVGAENSQVFVATDYIIIPTTTGARSTNAIIRIKKASDRCNESFQNCDIKLLGIVVNQVDLRTQITRAVVPTLQEEYGDEMFKVLIPIDENVKKAEQICQPAPALFPESKACEAYQEFTKEVLSRLGKI